MHKEGQSSSDLTSCILAHSVHRNETSYVLVCYELVAFTIGVKFSIKCDISASSTVELWLKHVWETDTVGTVDINLISGKFYAASHKVP